MPFGRPRLPPMARFRITNCGLSNGQVREPVPSFRNVKYLWPSTKASMWSGYHSMA